MEIHLLILGIILVVMLAALDSLMIELRLQHIQSEPKLATISAKPYLQVAYPQDSKQIVVSGGKKTHMVEQKPTIQPKTFPINFPDGHIAKAAQIAPDGDAETICTALKLETPRPAIFVSGGASLMSEKDIQRTRDIMSQGIAKFAQEFGVTVIDGGTEAGVMAMLGQARHENNYDFPLVGVAPEQKVAYPGKPNDEKDADLDDGHSHFVLVDADDWGEESQMIINLTRAVSANGERPACGILINGGRIAEHDVYVATAKGNHRIPMLILEGSGRAADDIATAFRTGKTNRAIIQAIIAGGAIKLVGLVEGPEAMYKQLKQHFGV